MRLIRLLAGVLLGTDVVSAGRESSCAVCFGVIVAEGLFDRVGRKAKYFLSARS
jgi:hypothetical protein